MCPLCFSSLQPILTKSSHTQRYSATLSSNPPALLSQNMIPVCFLILSCLFLSALPCFSWLTKLRFVNDYALEASDHLKGHHIIFGQKVEPESNSREPLVLITAETYNDFQC